MKPSPSSILLRLLPIGAVISVAAFGLASWSIVHKDDRLENALLALCALQDDLQRRVNDSREYLQKHPQGAPALGLSPADIRRSIDNQQRTIDSIDPYLGDCP